MKIVYKLTNHLPFLLSHSHKSHTHIHTHTKTTPSSHSYFVLVYCGLKGNFSSTITIHNKFSCSRFQTSQITFVNTVTRNVLYKTYATTNTIANTKFKETVEQCIIQHNIKYRTKKNERAFAEYVITIIKEFFLYVGFFFFWVKYDFHSKRKNQQQQTENKEERQKYMYEQHKYVFCTVPYLLVFCFLLAITVLIIYIHLSTHTKSLIKKKHPLKLAALSSSHRVYIGPDFIDYFFVSQHHHQTS